MSGFKEDKEKYLSLLEENVDLAIGLIEKNNDIKFERILVDPKDERELSIATNIFLFNCDYIKLLQQIELGLVDIPSPENVEGIQFLIKVMKLKREDKGEEIKNIDIYSSEISSEREAKILYDLLISLFGSYEECIKYIIAELNISIDSELSWERLNLALQEAQNELLPLQIDKPMWNLTDQELQKAKETIYEFHNLCKGNNKDNDFAQFLKNK